VASNLQPSLPGTPLDQRFPLPLTASYDPDSQTGFFVSAAHNNTKLWFLRCRPVTSSCQPEVVYDDAKESFLELPTENGTVVGRVVSLALSPALPNGAPLVLAVSALKDSPATQVNFWQPDVIYLYVYQRSTGTWKLGHTLTSPFSLESSGGLGANALGLRLRFVRDDLSSDTNPQLALYASLGEWSTALPGGAVLWYSVAVRTALDTGDSDGDLGTVVLQQTLQDAQLTDTAQLHTAARGYPGWYVANFGAAFDVVMTTGHEPSLLVGNPSGAWSGSPGGYVQLFTFDNATRRWVQAYQAKNEEAKVSYQAHNRVWVPHITPDTPYLQRWGFGATVSLSPTGEVCWLGDMSRGELQQWSISSLKALSASGNETDQTSYQKEYPTGSGPTTRFPFRPAAHKDTSDYLSWIPNLWVGDLAVSTPNWNPNYLQGILAPGAFAPTYLHYGVPWPQALVFPEGRGQEPELLVTGCGLLADRLITMNGVKAHGQYGQYPQKPDSTLTNYVGAGLASWSGYHQRWFGYTAVHTVTGQPGVWLFRRSRPNVA